MKKGIILVLTTVVVSAVVVSIAQPALGYVVTVQVEGVVTEVQTWSGLELDSSVSVGSVMTGSFTYDSEAPDENLGENGLYWLNSFSMSVGNYTFTRDPENAEYVYFHIMMPGFIVEPGQFRYEIRNFFDSDPLFYGPCYLDGQPTTLEDLDLPTRGMGIYLEGDNDGTITSALPNENTFPDLSVFTIKRFEVSNDIGPSFGIGAEITSITVIPEPGTVLLLGLGGLALRRKGKVQR